MNDALTSVLLLLNTVPPAAEATAGIPAMGRVEEIFAPAHPIPTVSLAADEPIKLVHDTPATPVARSRNDDTGRAAPPVRAEGPALRPEPTAEVNGNTTSRVAAAGRVSPGDLPRTGRSPAAGTSQAWLEVVPEAPERPPLDKEQPRQAFVSKLSEIVNSGANAQPQPARQVQQQFELTLQPGYDDRQSGDDGIAQLVLTPDLSFPAAPQSQTSGAHMRAFISVTPHAKPAPVAEPVTVSSEPMHELSEPPMPDPAGARPCSTEFRDQVARTGSTDATAKALAANPAVDSSYRHPAPERPPERNTQLIPPTAQGPVAKTPEETPTTTDAIQLCQPNTAQSPAPQPAPPARRMTSGSGAPVSGAALVAHDSGGPSPVRPHKSEADPAPALLPDHGSALAPEARPVQVHAARVLQNGTEMRVALRTETFGEVQVRATVADRHVDVSLGSERGDLRGWMASDLQVLQNHTQTHPLRLELARTPEQAHAGLDFASGSGRQQQFPRHPASAGFAYKAANEAEGGDQVEVARSLSIRI